MDGFELIVNSISRVKYYTSMTTCLTYSGENVVRLSLNAVHYTTIITIIYFLIIYVEEKAQVTWI